MKMSMISPSYKLCKSMIIYWTMSSPVFAFAYDHHHQHHHEESNPIMTTMTMAIPHDNIDCIANSHNVTCADYIYPMVNVTEDINDLCDDMPSMPGCTLRRYCQNDPKNLGSKPFCTNFSILADLCFDMPKMHGCKSYTPLCKSNSQVKQCTTETRLAPLPKWREAKNLAISICEEMTMSGCEKVPEKGGNFDVLPVYGQLCIEMPEMKQCGVWKSLCDAAPHLPFCPESSEYVGGPTMKMYFHWGYKDYVLFESWVPQNGWSYIWACLFCFFTGVLYESLLAIQGLIEEYWANMIVLRYQGVNDTSQNGRSATSGSMPSNMSGVFHGSEEVSLSSTSSPRKRANGNTVDEDDMELNRNLHQASNSASSSSHATTSEVGVTLNNTGGGPRESTLSNRSNQSLSEEQEEYHPLLKRPVGSSLSGPNLILTPSPLSSATLASKPHFQQSLFHILTKVTWTPLKIRLARSILRMVTITGAYICMLLVMSFNAGLFAAVVLGFGVGCFFFHDVYYENVPSAPGTSAATSGTGVNTTSNGVSTGVRVKPLFSTGKEHCC